VTPSSAVTASTPGRADQGLGQLEPADHPAGAGAGRSAGGVGEAEGVQGLGDAFGALAPRHVEDAGEPRDVLAAGEPGVGGQLLGGVAEQPSYGHAVPGGVVAEDAHHADGDRQQQRGDAPDGGGLARSVGSSQAEHLAFPDGQVEPVDGLRVAEGVGEPAER
jgi:hypothetical protein